LQLKSKLYRIWLYFKSGRNEIGTFYGVINTLILISLKYDLDVSLLWGMIYAVGFVTREVVPQNSLINPFTLDGIKSAVALQKSFIAHWEGDKEEAIKLMKDAVEYREKWFRE